MANTIIPVSSGAAPTLATLPDVQAALSAVKSPSTPFAGVPVATRAIAANGGLNNASGGYSNGTDTGANFQMCHYVLYDTSALRLVYFNPATRPPFGGGAAITQNAITIQSAVAFHPANTTNPSGFGLTNPGNVTWGGLPSVTIQPGKYVVSDPVPVPSYYQPGTYVNFSVAPNAIGFLPAGDLFYSRTFVSGATGTDGHFYYPTGTVLQLQQHEGSSHSTTETNETQMTIAQLNALGAATNTGQWSAGGDPPDQTANSQVWGPCAILGSPLPGASVKKTVGLFGDSIMQGTGDSYTSNFTIAGAAAQAQGYVGGSFDFLSYGVNQGIGAWSRAMEALKQPHHNVAVYGNLFPLMRDDVAVWPYLRACDTIVCEMGTNTISGFTDGASNANVTANVAAWFTASYDPNNGTSAFLAICKARGIKVVLTTFLPRTTSDGKTPTAFSNTVKAINNYLRANWQTLGAVGLLDWALAVESQSDQSTPLALATGLSGTGIYSSSVAQQALTSGGCWISANVNVSAFYNGVHITSADGTHPAPGGHQILASYIAANLPILLTK